MQILWLRPRETHLVTAMYLGCGCRAASPSHQLWGSLDAALSLFRILSSKMKAIFGFIRFYGQLSVLRQFFTGSSEKEGKRGRPIGECAQQRDWLGMLQSCCLQPCFFNAGTLYILCGCLFWLLLNVLTRTCCLTEVLPLFPSQQSVSVVSVFKAHLISVFCKQDYFDRAGEVMTQIVDSTNSCAGRSEEVATSGWEPWKAAVARHPCMEFGCSWNRMHSLELQSPFHQVKGRGRVNQFRTNENYSECWLIKLKATSKISEKKDLANVPPLSYFCCQSSTWLNSHPGQK